METVNGKAMMERSAIEVLSRFFGSYKAEWLQDTLYDLYTEPTYFPEITSARPCVLIGGRGTGKTTVLKSLSHEGQLEILKRHHPIMDEMNIFQEYNKKDFFGFYYRVSTHRVSAFQGGGIAKQDWQKLFLHYINITFSFKAFQFLNWHIKMSKAGTFFTTNELSLICKSLAIPFCENVKDIKDNLASSLIDIEVYINNIGITDKPRLSVPGALEMLFETLVEKGPFKGKTFFLIIDEYENFQDDQQQVINTLIKHTSTAFTFKIGVKYLGWRIKHTMNESEILISPSDYVSIDLATQMTERDYAKFAEKVCNARIKGIWEELNATVQKDCPSIQDMLPGLSIEEEAEILGVGEKTKILRNKINSLNKPHLNTLANSFSNIDLYVLSLWAEGAEEDFLEMFAGIEDKRDTWMMRINEYRYSALFNIKKKKAGIKKYYNGWSVYLKLCGGNIRYLLELVERSLIFHLRDDKTFGFPVSYRHQTDAARFVGKKNLEELGGLSIYGAKLTKLVLALGRVFQVLAEDSAGHSPEVNQFRIKAHNSHAFSTYEDWLLKSETNTSKIIQASVMHLALIPFPGNKPKGEGDIKDSTYQLHPIFAPYFIFSFRKRRNLLLEENEIVELIEQPKKTIKQVISRQNRINISSIPDQLKLFEGFWD